MKIKKIVAGLIPLVLLTGCSHFGSEKLVKNRFNYTAAIGESWKNQMLLNVVKLRYGDVPIFLSVQSVIDTNSIRSLGSASLNPLWSPVAWGASTFSGEVEYLTAPTVTYAPMGGAQFGKRMMTPIPTTSIVGLLQAGYPAEMILRLTVHSINGYENHFGLDKESAVNPTFYRLLDLVSALQATNSIGLRVSSADGKDTVLLSLHEPRDEDSRAKLDELRQLLGLDANTLDFSVVYGVMPANNKEIAILTRSVMDVLADLSASIDVPAQHISETRAAAANIATQAGGRAINPLMTIHATSSKPSESETAVAIPYHDYWYWISDRDITSKSTFSFLMFVMNLANSGEEEESPSIVLPTGR